MINGHFVWIAFLLSLVVGPPEVMALRPKPSIKKKKKKGSRPRKDRLKVPPSKTKSKSHDVVDGKGLQLRVKRTQNIKSLLASYRKRKKSIFSTAKLRFKGVGKKDVYNPSRPFRSGKKTIIAARVESRTSETDSQAVFFEKRGKSWKPVKGAPRLNLQDPFVSEVGGKLVIGGVETARQPNGDLGYKTVFYRGKDVHHLKRFAEGPSGMKDIRLAELSDGRIFVLTRPQGEKNPGKIGYLVLDKIADMKTLSQTAQSAKLIDGQLPADQWLGANQLIVGKKGKVHVLAHVARFDQKGERNYYAASFTIDLKKGKASPLQILLERRDLPRGLKGPSKREDLRNVIFSGGIVQDGHGKAALYVGGGDARTYKAVIPDPFR